MASPPNQHWIGEGQRNSPHQATLKHPRLISPDSYQFPNHPPTPATPNHSVQHSPGLSPSHYRGVRSVPPDPNANFMAQTPVAPIRTPTTPIQNPSCTLNYKDDLTSRNAFASPGSVGSSGRRSSIAVEQAHQGDPNSLRKLQQMTRDLPSESLYNPSMMESTASCQKSADFSSCGNKRQRYHSVGYSQRSSNAYPQGTFMMPNNQSSYPSNTTPARNFEGQSQHLEGRGMATPLSLNPSLSYSKDLSLTGFNANCHGLSPADSPWRSYPPNFSRQQSAPVYDQYSTAVPQHRSTYPQQPGYCHFGSSFQHESNPFEQNPFPPSLSGGYPPQNIALRSFSVNSGDFSSADNYSHQGGFSLHSNQVPYQTRPHALNPYHRQDNSFYRT